MFTEKSHAGSHESSHLRPGVFSFAFLTALLLTPLLVTSCQGSRDPAELRDTSGNFAWTDLQTLAETRPSGGEAGNKLIEWEPAYPLWSDGLLKRRSMFIPEGSTIDATELGKWVFPVGTRIWKEFALDTADGPKLIETRFMQKMPGGHWQFGSYVNDQLVPATGLAAVVPLTEQISHNVPAFDHCTYCHARGGDPVLGFDAIQLGVEEARSAGAEASQSELATLKSLIAAGQVTSTSGAVPEDVKFVGGTAQERQIVGYLHSNCAGCHSPTGSVRRFSLNLSPPLAADGTITSPESVLHAMINRRAQFHMASMPGFPGSQKLVDPGRPETSVLWYRVHLRQSPFMMPKVGSQLPDEQFSALLREWITGLPRP